MSEALHPSADLADERYVAFSFARADILLEIDKTGTITFSAGTLKGFFGVDVEVLTGQKLGAIMAPESAGMRSKPRRATSGPAC